MEELAPRPVPSKVQLIGVVHLVCGVLNMMTMVGLALYAIVFSLPTLGFSFLACCPMVLFIPASSLELYSGIRHLKKDHTGLTPPRLTAFAELATIMGCGIYSTIGGILTLVFLSDPEVAAYYDAQRVKA